MVQSPSWEANWFAASQEIPHISRKPKVHYRTQKRPPPISILGQPNPVHTPTSHLLNIHPIYVIIYIKIYIIIIINVILLFEENFAKDVGHNYVWQFTGRTK